MVSRTIPRRNVLRTIGAGSVLTLPSVAGASSERTIVTRMQSGEVHTEQDVPTSWLSHNRNVKRQAEQLHDDYEDNEGVLAVGRAKSDINKGGMNAAQLRLYVDENQEVDRDILPESVDGIPVEIKETEGDIKGFSCDVSCGDGAQHDEDPMIGGLPAFNDDEEWAGTFGYTAKFNGDEHLVTAHHGFLTAGDDCLDSQTAHVYDCSVLGTSAQITPAMDLIIFNHNGGVNSISEEIYRSSSSSTLATTSHFTEDGCEYARDQNLSIESEGVTTATTEGEITDVAIGFSHPENCASDSSWYVRIEDPQSNILVAGGDSGGPNFHEYSSGEATIVGHTVGAASTDDHHRCGPAAYHVFSIPAYEVANMGWDIGSPVDN